MKYIYGMQNLTFGPDGGLTKSCQTKFPDSPWYCFMSPHMQQFIKTPFYIFNSKYDAWQMGSILQIGCLCRQNATSPTTSCKNRQANCNRAKSAAIKQYGKDFLADLHPVVQESHNGAFITSCICHGCDWADLSVDKKTSYSYYADWYYGKGSGANVTVDTRGPNGDGALGPPTKEGGWANCEVGYQK